jgi:hypothetical protein
VATGLYESLGRQDIALELARGGVRHDPGSGGARLLLGMALEAQGRLREAALELRRAESLAGERQGRERARRLIDTLHAEASDSLRALFEADSAALAKEGAWRPLLRPPRRTVPARPDAPQGQPPRPTMAVPPEWTDSLFLPVRPDSK